MNKNLIPNHFMTLKKNVSNYSDSVFTKIKLAKPTMGTIPSRKTYLFSLNFSFGLQIGCSKNNHHKF